MNNFTLRENNDIYHDTYKDNNSSVNTGQYASYYNASEVSLSEMKNKLRHIEGDLYNFHKKKHLGFNSRQMISFISVFCFLFVFLFLAFIITHPEWFSGFFKLPFSLNAVWLIIPATIIGIIMQLKTNKNKKEYAADYNQRILKPVLENCYPGCTVRNNEKLSNNSLYLHVKQELDIYSESTLYVTGRYKNTEFEVSNITIYYDTDGPDIYGTLIMLELPCQVNNTIKVNYSIQSLVLLKGNKKVKLPNIENKSIKVYADDPYNLPVFFNSDYINGLTRMFPKNSLYKIVISGNHAFIAIKNIFLFAVDTRQRFSLDKAVDKIGSDMNMVRMLIDFHSA